jgi:hypothetical protein
MKNSIKSRYGPGAPVPHTGVYRVFHYQHRLPHDVVISKDGSFPLCGRCSHRVVFELRIMSALLLADPDFAPTEA